MNVKTTLIAVAAVILTATPVMAGEDATELRRSLLAFDDSKDVSIRKLVRPAGWVSPPHHHTGQVFLYVVEGAGEMELGSKTLTGGPGTIMEAQPGEVMIMKNASDSEPLHFMLFQIGPVGEPNIVLRK